MLLFLFPFFPGADVSVSPMHEDNTDPQKDNSAPARSSFRVIALGLPRIITEFLKLNKKSPSIRFIFVQPLAGMVYRIYLPLPARL
jgi:hypothetical protein